MSKIKLWLSASDGGDGSINVNLNNTKEEALEAINSTEEEIENGCFYDNGLIEEIELSFDENGQLTESFHINIE